MPGVFEPSCIAKYKFLLYELRRQKLRQRCTTKRCLAQLSTEALACMKRQDSSRTTTNPRERKKEMAPWLNHEIYWNLRNIDYGFTPQVPWLHKHCFKNPKPLKPSVVTCGRLAWFLENVEPSASFILICSHFRSLLRSFSSNPQNMWQLSYHLTIILQESPWKTPHTESRKSFLISQTGSDSPRSISSFRRHPRSEVSEATCAWEDSRTWRKSSKMS